MKQIVLASNNPKKIAELGTMLADVSSDGVEVLSLKAIGHTAEIIEDGDTFEENSLIKAGTAARLGYIGIADDSGLMVDALDGAPGIYSARYAGEDANDEKNRAKLLAALDGLPAEKRMAKFVCTASVVLPEGSELTIPAAWRIPEALAEKSGIPSERAMIVRGECPGVIGTEERGEGGFGYDSLFWYLPFGATFAEIPQEKKNEVSHRGVAMREFTSRLAVILSQKDGD